MLIDVSEEGLRCQIVGAVIEGDRCHLKFALPGRQSPIEADGQVVWSNKSGQGGGVQLVGLGANTRQELQRWILEGTVLNGPLNSPELTAGDSIAAVHRPPPNGSDFACPEPVTGAIVEQPPAALANPMPIEIEYRTVAETNHAPQSLVALSLGAAPLESERKSVQPCGPIMAATGASARLAKPYQAKHQVLLTIASEQGPTSQLSRPFLLAAGFAIGFAALAIYALQLT